MTNSASPADAPPLEYPRRFGWPMRVFLGLFLFHMIAGSLLELLPYDDWAVELAVVEYPLALPSEAELAQIAAGRHEQFTSRGERYLATGRSTLAFWNPWPGVETRRRMFADATVAGRVARMGKYAAAWLGTRLRFVGNLTGVDQKWTMFSPEVSTHSVLPRYRLIYAGGAERIVPFVGDQADMASYGHRYPEKYLQAEMRAVREADEAARLGIANLLLHRYPSNEGGEALARIEVFRVRYRYPPPGADAAAFLRGQSGPPAEQVEPPFWVFDVVSRRGALIPEAAP